MKAGEPVRLAQPVKVHVWTPDAGGKLVKSANTITIQEGWYALPDPTGVATPAK